MSLVEQLSELSPLTDALDGVAARLRSSVVAVHNGGRGGGTGVVWPEDGLVITNEHVVRGRDRHEIGGADGRRLAGTVVARDPENDLAALRTEDPAGIAAEVGESRRLRIGELVLAIGHPVGVEHAVTAGIVSGLPGAESGRELIQSHLTLNPGNSGGPLLDARGRVVGINAMVSGPRTALSIPSHVVRAFLARALRRVPPFGVELQPVELPALWQGRVPGGQRGGVLVTNVLAGSAAEAAGLYPGDIIVGINAEPVASPYRLRDELLLSPEGQLRLTLLRAGSAIEIEAERAVTV